MSFPFFIEEFVLLSILAALLAVDERAGWQSLLSNPVFVALIIGSMFGQLAAAMLAGVTLELVWLSILPMRGMRRADTVAGAVIGIGTTCALLRYTADPRVGFIVATGVFIGLAAGQVAGFLTRWLNRRRELILGNFELPENRDPIATARRLAVYNVISIGFVALSEVVVVALGLPLALFCGERFTAMFDGAVVAGSVRWLELLPMLGAAAVIQLHWQRDASRFLVLSAGIILVVLWIR